MSAVGQGEQSPDKASRYFEGKSRKSPARSPPRNMLAESAIIYGSSRNVVDEPTSQVSSGVKGRRTKQDRKSAQKKPRTDRENYGGLKILGRPNESPKSRNE